MKDLTLMPLLTIIALAITVTGGQNFGSEVCKSTSCNGLILIAASCNYSADTAREVTAAQAYCTCHNENFTASIEPCLDCMEPYNIAIYKESTWKRLCPNLLEDDDDDSDNETTQTNSSPRSFDGCKLSTMGALFVGFGMAFWSIIV